MNNLKSLFFSLMVCMYMVSPATANAQKGNSLHNIPVTDLTGVVTNAQISIDDFYVVDNQVYVTSTLTGTAGGQQVVQTVSYPLSIQVATCDLLVLQPGVVISGTNFQIANFVVNISPTQSTDSRLRAALCSIARLQNSNASAEMLIAKIKQAVRALVPVN